MPFFRFNKYAHSLGYQNRFSVYLPDSLAAGEEAEVLYCLHGLSGNQTDFESYNLFTYAEKLKIVLVYVNAHNSYYLNTKTGEKFAQYVAEEIPNELANIFSFKMKKKSIIGISMGGYGAMYLGLTYNFSTIINLSGAVKLDNRLKNTDDNRFVNILDEVTDDLKIDKLLLKEENKGKRIFTYCGTNDFLYQDNLEIMKIISQQIKDYQISTDEGDHCFYFWNNQMEKAFKYIKGDENENTSY